MIFEHAVNCLSEPDRETIGRDRTVTAKALWYIDGISGKKPQELGRIAPKIDAVPALIPEFVKFTRCHKQRMVGLQPILYYLSDRYTEGQHAELKEVVGNFIRQKVYTAIF